MGPFSATKGMLTARRCTSPPWFAISVDRICECEPTLTAFGLVIAADLFKDEPVLLRCDNTDANGTTTRGSNKTAMGRSIASVFWNNAAVAGCMVWVEYVRSPLNHADPPFSDVPLPVGQVCRSSGCYFTGCTQTVF